MSRGRSSVALLFLHVNSCGVRDKALKLLRNQSISSVIRSLGTGAWDLMPLAHSNPLALT